MIVLHSNLYPRRLANQYRQTELLSILAYIFNRIVAKGRRYEFVKHVGHIVQGASLYTYGSHPALC